MINCSSLTTTSEETRSWYPNNDSTRGSAFNARTAQGRYLCSKILAQVPLPLGLGHQVDCSSKEHILAQVPLPLRLGHLAACSKEHSLAQVPFQLGLGHQAACSSQGPQPRSSASLTGTRPPSSLFLPWNTASLKGLSHSDSTPSSLFLPRNTASLKCLPHWDSATKQLILPKEHSLAQVPLPLGLDHLAACSKKHSLAQVPIPLGLGHQPACSSQGTQPRSSASPTGTRPPSDLFLPRNTASLKCLSHWDSATKQLVPLKEHSLAQVPLPLGLGHLPACSKEHSLAQVPLPLGFGHQAACSSQGTQPRSSDSPTGTRPPSNLFLPRNTASLKCLSYWDSATKQLVPPIEHSLAQVPLPLGLGHKRACSSHGTQPRSRASPLRLGHQAACSSQGT
ncbi:hypothetical protein Adt_28463 [Abeliophyllum distichum]|uniref:Uncharacterized protein n=1 Tax=Abeliophyllum distichum TaxID=126358 RepID=A0ABD1RWL1_9LAMI